MRDATDTQTKTSLLGVDFKGNAFDMLKDDICGTYRLISSTRRILSTNEVVETYGANPNGYIMYGEDGRMMAMITFADRQKPHSIEAMSDADRATLFKTMLAYAGTYEIKEDRIYHHLELSWNEVWTGTTLVRYFEWQGNHLILTTAPGPFSSDGEMSEIKLVWEKMQSSLPRA